MTNSSKQNKLPMESGVGGGGGGGGFHGYRKLPNTAGGLKLSAAVSDEIQNNNHNSNSNNNNHSSSSSSAAAAAELVLDNNECTVREQDRFMPIANVIRIMRKILPPHAKISDDAKETIQECVSEYISFITGEANERCQREQRKTITAEDVLWAMSKLGFDDYIEPLTMYLHRYRELEGDRTSIRSSAEPMGKRGITAATTATGLEYHHHHHHHHTTTGGATLGFVPQFHIAHPNGGYYGAGAPPTMGLGTHHHVYTTTAPAAPATNAGASSQPAAAHEPNGQYN